MAKNFSTGKNKVNGLELIKSLSFGVTKSETNMLAFTGGSNTRPDQWESKATKLFGEELSSFIKSGSLRLVFSG